MVGAMTAFLANSTHNYNSLAKSSLSSSSMSMMMGLLDFVREKFLDSRDDDGDFVPLDRSDNDKTFGPGPLLLAYAVPRLMFDDEELQDMVEDGMANRRSSVVVIRRLEGVMDDNGDGEGGDDDALLDMTLGEALERAMMAGSGGGSSAKSSTADPIMVTKTPAPVVASSARGSDDTEPSSSTTTATGIPPPTTTPVLYFSGVSNREMMETYEIISGKMYEEKRGATWPACAKAVPPALTKLFAQRL